MRRIHLLVASSDSLLRWRSTPNGEIGAVGVRELTA
jgi:hypothetical protein